MDPVFHIFPALLPNALYAAVWSACQQPRWGFGSQSTPERGRPFWHMDLAGSMNASFWAVAALTYSDDLREGVNAALEKRAAVYNKADRSSS